MAADLGQGVLAGHRRTRLPVCRAWTPLAASAKRSSPRCPSRSSLPPRPALYTGLAGPTGEAGFWLDGGLQSVNPAARAVALHERQGARGQHVPRARHARLAASRDSRPSLLGTVVTIGTRLIGWETSYAGLEQHRRHAHACELGGSSASTRSAPEAPRPRRALAAPPELLSVSVPDDIAPAALFASGYTFDPIVMRGLFLWGERALLAAAREVLGFLGWCAPLALEQAGVKCPGAEGANPAFAAAIANSKSRVSAEIATYKKFEAPGAWTKHLQERKTIVNHELQNLQPQLRQPAGSAVDAFELENWATPMSNFV